MIKPVKTFLQTARMVCVLLCFAHVAAFGATFTVNRTEDRDQAANDCAQNVLPGGVLGCSLREAIRLANTSPDSDTINIALGNAAVITLTQGELIFTQSNQSITINGGGAFVNGNNTDGDGVPGTSRSRVFRVAPGASAALNNLTITGGNGVGGGTVSIFGGGIYVDGGTLAVTNSTVRGNIADSGGGILNRDGTLTVTNSTISGNTARFSGGGFTSDTQPGTSRQTIIRNSTISGNTANSLSISGGGIFNTRGMTIIESVTITNNAAPNSEVGGGVASRGVNGTRTEARNTIISGNANGDVQFVEGGANLIVSRGNNLVGSGNATGAFDAGNNDLVGVDAQLQPLGNYGGATETHALRQNSPAINAGSNSGIPLDTADLDGDGDTTEATPFDQRGAGFPRVEQGTVDIGAFEGVGLIVTNTSDAPSDNVCTPANVDDGCSLREAIAAAEANAGADVINVAVTGTVNLTSSLPTITQSLTINGGSQTGFVVRGRGLNVLVRPFTVSAGVAVAVNINNLTVRDGNGNFGGGIYVEGGATVTLANLTATDNYLTSGASSTGGAGIAVAGSTLNVVNSRVQNNEAQSGNGGGIRSNDSALTITNSVIATNSTAATAASEGLGGAIYARNGSLTITNSTISGNRTSGTDFRNGGGLYLIGVAARIENSVLNFNRAEVGGATSTGGEGGGIFGSGGALRMSNVTFYLNQARNGGAIYLSAVDATLRNVTVGADAANRNRATTGQGGGIYATNNAVVRLANTIAANNVSGTANNPSDFYAQNTTITLLTRNIVRSGVAGTGNTISGAGTTEQVDPKLGALACEQVCTVALDADSPAIDAGTNAEALDTQIAAQPLTTDARGAGFARVREGNNDGAATVDLGAFELQAAAPIDLTISQSAPQTATQGQPLTYTLVVTNTGAGSATNVAARFALPANTVCSSTTASSNFAASQCDANTTAIDFTGGAINANGSAQLSVTVTPTAVGTITSFGSSVVADPANNVAESDETNNTAADATTAVAAPNNAPTASAVPNPATTDEDSSVDILLRGSDPDGDNLTFNVNAPANGALSNQTVAPCFDQDGTRFCSVQVTYTPNRNFNGSDSFTFTVTDSNNATSQPVTVSITVNSVNDAPDAVNDTATVAEDSQATTINVLSNDTDADGDSLFITDNTLPSNNAGTVEIAVDRQSLRFTPAANFFGTTTFRYFINDRSSGGLSDEATVTVTVTPVNDAPIANNGSAATDEDTPVNGQLTASDVDPNTVLTYTIVTQPTKGTLTAFNPNTGAFTYTPNLNENGADGFTFRASDGISNSAPAAFTINIAAVNDAPVVSDISNQITNEDTPTNPIAFTIGDQETTVNNLVVTGTSSNQNLVPNGNIVFGGSGANRTVTITPAANQFGTATITIRVTDADNAFSQDTFVLTVSAVNDAPTITDIADQSTAEDTAKTVSFTVGDQETAAGDLTVAAVSNNQTLVPNNRIAIGGSGANRTLTATPAANQSGTATITVTVSDNAAGTSDTFVLTVTAVNDQPTIAAAANVSRQQQAAVSRSQIAAVNDIEDAENALSVTINGASSATVNGVTVSNISVDSAGNVTADIVAATDSQTATFTLRVTDAGNLFAETALTVTVTPETTAPTVTNIADNIASNQVGRREPVTYTITFSEPVRNVDADDFENAGTAAVSFGNFPPAATSSQTVSFTVTPTTTGTIVLRVRAGATITDSVGNALANAPFADDETIQVLLRRPRSSPTFPGKLEDDKQ